MKINKFVASLLCAGAFFTSCSHKTAEENQVKYTHTSRVDGDAFHFFQVVGEIIPYEVGYASYVSSVNSSEKVKEVASDVEKVYRALFSELDSIGTKFYVELPIRGATSFEAKINAVASQDSTQSASIETFSDESYLKHTQKEQALVIEQFERLTRNTNKKLREFAVKNIHTLEELYAKSGGAVHNHDHH